MSLVQDRCTCLRNLAYSETSQILLLFGRAHGLIRVIAKGAHRRTKAGATRFDGGIDLLDVGDAVFSAHTERDLSTLTAWHLLEGHQELRRHLRGVYLGFYAAELVSLLIEEHDPHPELFDSLERSLLELSTARVEQAFLAFQLDLLRETGYLPEMFQCVNCGLPATDRTAAAFCFERSGVLCRNCEATFPNRLSLEGRLIGIVQYILGLADNGSARRLPGLSRHQTDPINKLLARYIEYNLDRRLRLPRFILAGNGLRFTS
jgi:DNA repair protein RecO (recombination protein O)